MINFTAFALTVNEFVFVLGNIIGILCTAFAFAVNEVMLVRWYVIWIFFTAFAFAVNEVVFVNGYFNAYYNVDAEMIGFKDDGLMHVILYTYASFYKLVFVVHIAYSIGDYGVIIFNRNTYCNAIVWCVGNAVIAEADIVACYEGCIAAYYG